jgi:hypothetical protein
MLHYTEKFCFATFNMNSVLTRTNLLGPKKGEVTRGWIKICNDELQHVCYSSNIIKAIKSINMKYIGHVARMGYLSDRMKGRDQLET